MNRGWYGGYLVRALNEFASLTVQCGAMNGEQAVSTRAKASRPAEEHQRPQKKSCDTAKKRKYNRDG